MKFITSLGHYNLKVELSMCEFNVILDGETVFKDTVYAKIQSDNVIIKDVLGETKQFISCQIVEVDVNSARLVLASIK